MEYVETENERIDRQLRALGVTGNIIEEYPDGETVCPGSLRKTETEQLPKKKSKRRASA